MKYKKIMTFPAGGSPAAAARTKQIYPHPGAAAAARSISAAHALKQHQLYKKRTQLNQELCPFFVLFLLIY